MGIKSGIIFLLLTSVFLSVPGYGQESVIPFSDQRAISAYLQEAPPIGPAIAADEEEEPGTEASEDTIADPLEPINRLFFEFNDRLYFWLLKPVATAYKAVAPQTARVGVRNFFYNLGFPIRFVNCLLQGKGVKSSDEFVRFFVNSTLGLGGLVDVASYNMQMKKNNEDLGQTFGSYGMGPAFYINWPILGPSSMRDTLGKVGDAFIDPLSYVENPYDLATRAYDTVNETSLRLGDYEDLKKSALDPYIALRNAYYENRKAKIRE